MWLTIVLQSKRTINQVWYLNRVSLLCFNYRKAHIKQQKVGKLQTCHLQLPVHICSTCHGNHVIVALSTTNMCSCFRGLHCHRCWIARLQAPASKWRHPLFLTWLPPSTYLLVLPNEPIHLCSVTIQTCQFFEREERSLKHLGVISKH